MFDFGQRLRQIRKENRLTQKSNLQNALVVLNVVFNAMNQEKIASVRASSQFFIYAYAVSIDDCSQLLLMPNAR